MSVFAYQYQDLTWETPLDIQAWGWEIDEVIQDFHPHRPHLLQWLESAQSALQPTTTAPGQTYFLLRRLEELGSSFKQLSSNLTALESQGIIVLTLEQNYHSPSAPMHSSHDTQPPSLQLLALLDSIQAQQRSHQIRHGHARNRLKGKPPPGPAPYGYRRGKERYVIDRGVAPIVKDFFGHFLLYGSLRGAVKHLETKHSKKISVSTGQRWLTSPVYRGDLQYRDQDILPDTHPALLSRDEAAQVDRLLRRNRSLAPRSASAPRSLAGLAHCAHCTSAMTITRVTTHRRSTEYLYLRPIRCQQTPKCKAIPYPEVLKQTIQQICIQLPQAIAATDTTAIGGAKQALQAQIQRKDQALKRLPQLVADATLDPTTADLRTYTLKNEISALRTRLAQLPPVNLQEIAKTVSIDQFWFDLSETERRFYFREFIRRIDIDRQEKHWSVQLIFIF